MTPLRSNPPRRRALLALGGALWAAPALRAAAQGGPIVVAQVGPFTGLPSPDAKEINEGAKAWFQRVNADGGIRGRRIEIFELDDQFKADVFVSQFQAAMQKKPVVLFNPIGSAAMTRMIQDKLLDASGAVVINAIPGAEPFRKPGHPKLFHVRASDRQQIEKIVQTARTLGQSKLAVLHQDLPIGTAGLRMAQEAGARDDVKIAITAAQAKHDDAAIAAAARTLAGGSPHGALVIGTPKFMADAVRELRKAGVSQFVFALSYLPAALAVKVAGDQAAQGVAIAQTFPNPNGVNQPVQREFQAAMRAAFPNVPVLTAFHFEGYLSARVLTDAMKRVNGDMDGEAIARALKGLGQVDYGGFRLNFAASQEGSSFVDIGVVGANGKLRY